MYHLFKNETSLVAYNNSFVCYFGLQQEKYPESFAENGPVFYAKATINGTSVDLTAGINGNVNNPYFYQDTDGVYKFVSEFKPATCQTNCSNSIYLQINDYTVSVPNGPISINSAVNPAVYQYQSDTNRNVFRVQFNSSYNKPAKVIYGILVTVPRQPFLTPEHGYKRSRHFTRFACEVTGLNGCSSSICNRIEVVKESPVRKNIGCQRGQWLSEFSSQVSGGQPPASYYWVLAIPPIVFFQIRHPYLIEAAILLCLKLLMPIIKPLLRITTALPPTTFRRYCL